MRIGVMILGRYSDPSPDKLYDYNKKILTSKEHEVSFIHSCWNIDAYNNDKFKKYNLVVAQYPSTIPNYNPYKLLMNSDVIESSMFVTPLYGKALKHATVTGMQEMVGRIFQHLQFSQIYDTIKNEYDYILRIRWDTVIKDTFNLDSYISLIQEYNDKLVLGFATKRQHLLQYLYPAVTEQDIVSSKPLRLLSEACMRHAEKISFYNTKVKFQNPEIYSTLWDIGILFNTKIDIKDAYQLYYDKQLLPAEWGWYQLFKSNDTQVLNVSNEMIHERAIKFNKWNDYIEHGKI
jgi:hypothetical protein